MNIGFGRQVCGSLDEAASREWLLTDGLGGYAMGTVAGLRTRRYHALQVVPVAGSATRMVGLAALDAVVVVGDRRVRLATHEWTGGAVDPDGHLHLASFEIAHGVPRWRWSIGDVVVEREIAMSRGRSAVAVRHRLLAADGEVTLELTPLCTWRDHHADRHAGGDPEVEAVDRGFVFEGAYRVAGPGWQPGGEWYRGARLREEAARGLADHEDLWAAGRFVADLGGGAAATVVAVAAPYANLPDGEAIIAEARSRAALLARAAGAADESTRLLVHAADQFVVSTPSGPTVIAGYPWFGEWSRDLMTAYEGLFLTTRRFDEGREVLRRAARTLSDGMLANTADTGSPEYNTADATLWFIHAVGRHTAVTGDDDLVDEITPMLHEILDWHVEGTRYGIGVESDGLLSQGAEGLALTWMDARVEGAPITPRSGKAVDINALWVEALDVVQEVTDGGDRWKELADRAAASFASRFRRPDGRGLYDVVDGPSGDDATVRPNQLLALSLLGPSLKDAGVLETTRVELLTSIGLRSLAPSDPAYRPHHRGGPAERDGAYHQGTVWPWLIGPYVDAARVAGASIDGLGDALALHLREWGLGSVSETADGDAPHRSTGCPFQAWSVAEFMRVWWRL